MSAPDWKSAAEMSLKLDQPARAQVEATLALVEQQKLANEIAFLRFTFGMIHNGKATDVDDAGLQALADRVTEGLGL